MKGIEFYEFITTDKKCKNFSLDLIYRGKDLTWIYENYKYRKLTNKVKKEIRYCLEHGETPWHTRAKNKQFTNNGQKLTLINSERKTVAYIQAYHGWQPKGRQFYISNDDEISETVAHIYFLEKFFNNEKDKIDEYSNYLKIFDNRGNTVAHYLVKYGWYPKENKELLLLKNDEDVTVAHNLARYKPDIASELFGENKEILKLRRRDQNTVAHILAYHSQIKWTTKDKEILSLRNAHGDTVAHYLAEYGRLKVFDKDILLMKNNNNVSVVSYLFFDSDLNVKTKKIKKIIQDPDFIFERDAYGNSVIARYFYHNNYCLDDEKLLTIKDSRDWTVAHELSLEGFFTKDKKILNLKDKRGFTVEFIQYLFSLKRHLPTWHHKIIRSKNKDKEITLDELIDMIKRDTEMNIKLKSFNKYKSTFTVEIKDKFLDKIDTYKLKSRIDDLSTKYFSLFASCFKSCFYRGI